MKKLFKGLLFLITILSMCFGLPEVALGASLAYSGAVAATMSNNFVSGFDLNKRQVYEKLIARYGDQGLEFIMMLMGMGWEDTCSVKTIEHFEDDWISPSFTVNAGTAGSGAGAAKTIVINSASINNDGQSFPVVKDVIEFPGVGGVNPVLGMITAKSGANLTVVPLKAADTIPAVTQGQVLIIQTNANAEGSFQMAPKARGAALFQNGFQIVKADISATGSEMTTDSWIQVAPDGSKVGPWYNLALNMDLDFRMAKAIQGALLVGQTIDNPLALDPDTATQPNGTKGLFPTLNDLGIQHPYITFGIADFDTIERAIAKVYGGTTTACLFGIDLDIQVENTLKTYFNFTNIDYIREKNNANLFGNEKGMAAAVGFSYLEKAKRAFAFKRFDTLTDPQSFGADGYSYTSRGVMFPLRAKNKIQLTDGSSAMIPSLRVRYKAADGYNRKMEVFNSGSANAAKWGVTNTQDVRSWHQRSEVGLEVFGANSMVNIYLGS
jgi:hypothetical protein